jgi:putative flippase GtrA
VSKYSYLSKKFKNVGIIKKFPVLIQFCKFCMVGWTNVAVDYLVYWLLARIFGWYYMLARVIAFIVAVTWSFFLNRRWTFKHCGRKHSAQYAKFFVANGISMVLNLALFYLFVEHFSMNDTLAFLLVAALVSVFNFSINYFWAFGRLDHSLATGLTDDKKICRDK